MSGSQGPAFRMEDVTWQVAAYGEGLDPADVRKLEEITSGEHMIPLTPESIAEHRLSVLAKHCGDLAGYTGVTSEYAITDGAGAVHRAFEVGGAVVLPKYRGHGLAAVILDKVITTVRESAEYPDGTRLVAFTNEMSRGYMERAGMKPLKDGEQLSASAFALCANCTHCPVQGLMPWEDTSTCCDADGIRVIEL